jgi:hypothetical protein
VLAVAPAAAVVPAFCPWHGVGPWAVDLAAAPEFFLQGGGADVALG